MRAAVIVFPGSNCDRDIAVAVERVTGLRPQMVWHRETELPEADLIVLPGGFSYGDYLRCGAMAARSPIIPALIAQAEAGVPVLGVCNGFQMLTEIGLLPGALMRNRDLHFVCRDVLLRVDNADTGFTHGYRPGQVLRCPIAHHDGNYFADTDTLKRLADQRRIVFRYVDADGQATAAANPNGSADNIAGILNDRGNVLGMMPHPERLIDPLLGGTDGRALFEALAAVAA